MTKPRSWCGLEHVSDRAFTSVEALHLQALQRKLAWRTGAATVVIGIWVGAILIPAIVIGVTADSPFADIAAYTSPLIAFTLVYAGLRFKLLRDVRADLRLGIAQAFDGNFSVRWNEEWPSARPELTTAVLISSLNNSEPFEELGFEVAVDSATSTLILDGHVPPSLGPHRTFVCPVSNIVLAFDEYRYLGGKAYYAEH